MWPEHADKWLAEWEPDAIRHVEGRLRQFPVLRAFVERLAGTAVARATEIARYHHRSPGYFRHQYDFGRWFRIASYRESLRLALQPEPVEAILDRLPEDMRLHLRLRYIDQLADEEIARVLDMRQEKRPLFNAGAARAHGLRAYDELNRGLASWGSSSPVSLELPVRFPLYPNVCVAQRDGGMGVTS